jgi:hypothetical protein
MGGYQSLVGGNHISTGIQSHFYPGFCRFDTTCKLYHDVGAKND